MNYIVNLLIKYWILSVLIEITEIALAILLVALVFGFVYSLIDDIRNKRNK